jgi:protein-tyrosine-phosphatase
MITRETRNNADIIINMTGSPAKRILPSEESKTEDWMVTDPYGERIEAYRDTCEEIEARMTEFVARLRTRRAVPAESAAK